jgi:hypothetical protein
MLLAGLAVAGCARDESGPADCPPGDQECIDEARIAGRDVRLVNAQGDPVDPSGAAVTDATQATIPGAEPFWRLEVGNQLVEGRLGFVGGDEGRQSVQLVSRDGTNLLLVWPEQGGAEREVEQALFAFGRGPTCALVRSDPPFTVELNASEAPWIAGRYSGMLGCPDYSALSVSGVFRVREQEEN